MADRTPYESITEVVPQVLGQYLLDSIPDLDEYYDEFPNPSMSLQMPSVSIIASSGAQFRPMANPSLVTPIDPSEIVEHKADVNWVIGYYDFKIQLDLWARNKEERDDLYNELFNALNPNIPSMGLVLAMPDYFNQLCSYTLVGHNFGDTGEQSQRDEWRSTLELVVNCKAVYPKQEYVMEDGELDLQLRDTNEPL